MTRRARERLLNIQEQEGHFLSRVPGKAAISQLSQWSQGEFGVQISALKLAQNIHQSEIALEVENVMTAIETLEPFD